MNRNDVLSTEQYLKLYTILIKQRCGLKLLEALKAEIPLNFSMTNSHLPEFQEELHCLKDHITLPVWPCPSETRSAAEATTFLLKETKIQPNRSTGQCLKAKESFRLP